MTRPITLLLSLVLSVAGCGKLDPYQREGAWRPNGANAINLRAMVAVPADLVTAEPAAPADGHRAAEALNRLRQDRVRPLPDSGLADIVPIKDTSAASPAAAPAAAAASGSN